MVSTYCFNLQILFSLSQGLLNLDKGEWKGDVYEGEFREGQFHGQGMYKFSDGRKYVGEWVDGKMHGQGRI